MMMRDIDFKRLLIHDIIIQRQVYTKKDKLSGFSRKYRIIERVKGRITTTGASSSDRFITNQDIADLEYKLFVKTNVNIRKGDRVISRGNYYHVDDIREPSHMGHHIEASLILTQPDEINKGEVLELSVIEGGLKNIKNLTGKIINNSKVNGAETGV